MPLWSLTHERVEQLKKEQADTEEQIRRLEAMEAKDMWAQDLDEFLEELKDWEETEVAAMHANLKVKAKGGRRLGGAGTISDIFFSWNFSWLRES
jgi:DNA topoisomerase-2